MNGIPTLLLLGLLGLSKHSYFAAYIIEETLVMYYIMDIEEKPNQREGEPTRTETMADSAIHRQLLKVETGIMAAVDFGSGKDF